MFWDLEDESVYSLHFSTSDEVRGVHSVFRFAPICRRPFNFMLVWPSRWYVWIRLRYTRVSRLTAPIPMNESL